MQQVDPLLIDHARASELRQIADASGVSMQAWVEHAIAQAYAKLPTDATGARPGERALGEIPGKLLGLDGRRYRVFIQDADLYTIIGALMGYGLPRIAQSLILQLLDQRHRAAQKEQKESGE